VIYCKEYKQYWHLAFIGESGKYKGLGDNDFIMVECRVGRGYWVTVFQPVDLDRQ